MWILMLAHCWLVWLGCVIDNIVKHKKSVWMTWVSLWCDFAVDTIFSKWAQWRWEFYFILHIHSLTALYLTKVGEIMDVCSVSNVHYSNYRIMLVYMLNFHLLFYFKGFFSSGPLLKSVLSSERSTSIIRLNLSNKTSAANSVLFMEEELQKTEDSCCTKSFSM